MLPHGACLTVHTVQFACQIPHPALKLIHADEVAHRIGWAMALLCILATSGTQGYVPCVLAPVAASLPDFWLDATAAAEYDASFLCR